MAEFNPDEYTALLAGHEMIPESTSFAAHFRETADYFDTNILNNVLAVSPNTAEQFVIRLQQIWLAPIIENQFGELRIEQHDYNAKAKKFNEVRNAAIEAAKAFRDTLGLEQPNERLIQQAGNNLGFAFGRLREAVRNLPLLFGSRDLLREVLK